MNYIKKILVILITLSIISPNIIGIDAATNNDTPKTNTNFSQIFIDNINNVYSSSEEYTVHDQDTDITEAFISTNRAAFEHNNYESIWNYFVENQLHILGAPTVEKVPSTRGLYTYTYRKSQPYFTTLVPPSGQPSVEFQANVYCQAQVNDRTGAYYSVSRPYIGEWRLDADNVRINSWGSSEIRDGGTYCIYTLNWFDVSAMNDEYLVSFSRVYCNLSGSF